MTKIPTITLQTYAYNAENDIRQCIESVLNQSFSNFEWLVIDNGSQDRTGEILREYASKDSRIKVFRNDVNTLQYHEFNPEFIQHYENMQSEYWGMLDSDDFLHPDFLEIMYKTGIQTNADIIVSGTEMFRDNNVTMRACRIPPAFHVKCIEELGNFLQDVYGSFRPIWGKLFKRSIVEQQRIYRTSNPIKVVNGRDTLFSLDCLKFAESVVGVDKVLHYYRIRENSVYNSNINKERYLAYKEIYESTKQLLKDWNQYTPVNSKFISGVLYVSVKECIEIAAKTQKLSVAEKLHVISEIVTDESLNLIFKEFGLTNQLFKDIRSNLSHIELNESDIFECAEHYLYRLFRSIESIDSKEGDLHHSLLLYLSAIVDSKNRNRFGASALYLILRACGKRELTVIESYPISYEFLFSSQDLLREWINSDWESVRHRCDQNINDKEFQLLRQCTEDRKSYVDTAMLDQANQLVRTSLFTDNHDTAADLLEQILDSRPLDQKGLISKLSLHAYNQNHIYVIEMFEMIKVLFEKESEVLSLANEVLVKQGYKTLALIDEQ